MREGGGGVFQGVFFFFSSVCLSLFRALSLLAEGVLCVAFVDNPSREPHTPADHFGVPRAGSQAPRNGTRQPYRV